MEHSIRFFARMLVAVCLYGSVVHVSHAASFDLYVSPSGSDKAQGTQSDPFKTILKASQVAQPGTVVHVASGVYEGSFVTRASGTTTDRIVYRSETV